MKKNKAQILPTIEALLDNSSFDAYAPMEIIDDYDDPLPRRSSMSKHDLQVWIKSTEEYLGLNDSSLARGAGLHHSLIQKFMKPDSKSSLQTKTLLAIDNFARQKVAEKIRTKPHDTQPDDLIVCSVDVLNILTSGTVRSNEILHTAYKSIVPIARRWTHNSIIGIKIDTDDMNIIYPRNTVVFAVPVSSIGRQVRTGDHVVAFKKERDVHFCYVREFRLEDDGTAWLWPKSTLPDMQSPNPITLGSTKTDALERGLKVAFLIVSSIRPEPSL